MIFRRKADEHFFGNAAHRLDELLEPAIKFWKTSVDWKQGGFYGQVDYGGEPRTDADKYVVQQVRHLWTFSEIHRFEDDGPEIAAICDHQFRFVRDHLFDAERSEFYRWVSAEGEPSERGVHHYELAFGIYSLANYACAFVGRATGREAFEIAKSVFIATVQKSWDPTHGFDEDVYPNRWCTSAKEINTQMHLMEAVTALLQAARMYTDPIAGLVQDVLERQVDLLCSLGIVTQAGRTFCSRGYDHDWTLIDTVEVDYGHDIEVVFLAMEAARVLGRQGESEIVEPVTRLGRSVTAAAYDRRRGRWFYSGRPLTGKVVQRVSNIWTNFEALNGLATMYQLTGEAEFISKYDRVLAWLESKQINREVGEWYYNVDGRGRPVGTDVFGNDCAWMSFAWKSSYHSTRSLLHGKRWARAEL